jgi:hypothetical protein
MGLRRRLPHRRPKDSGQGLVEFALALPIFVLLLTGTIEFGFLYNNLLTVQFAARQGVTVAAEAGATDGADCAILKAVELGLSMPVDRSKVTEVEIFQSDANGDPIPDRVNTYTRSGTLDCGTTTQPYSLVGAEGYPQTERKDNLSDGLDVVGVRIAYQYTGITPIGSGHTWVLSDGATLRMEPKQ